MRTAILVIDMQNDFIEDDGMIQVDGIKQNLGKFREFLTLCRAKDIPILYTRHLFDPHHNKIEGLQFPSLIQGGLRAGEWGSQIHRRIAPEKNERIVDKHRYDAFFSTDLEMVLRGMGIERVVITGTMTNICCESTARAAMQRNFHVLFSSDLTFTYDPILHEATLKNIASHFGKVRHSREILQALEG